jgi:trimeric autotransporter adhesin
MPRHFSVVCAVVTALSLWGCDDHPTAPSPLFELTLSPATVTAGATSEGTVSLRERTQKSVQINLMSSDAVASVPTTIVVPAGTLTAAFTVATRLVAADTIARIVATAGDTTQQITLQVVAPVVSRPTTLDALELDASTLRGGQTAQGTIRLTGPAPAGGLSVNVRSSNSAALVPTTVLFQAGTITATFTVSARPVDLSTQLEITAAYADQTRTVSLRVTP